jgi:hypothetical protein
VSLLSPTDPLLLEALEQACLEILSFLAEHSVEMNDKQIRIHFSFNETGSSILLILRK